MNEEKFNMIMHFNYLFILALVAVCEISNILAHSKMTNKLHEISEKVGIECNVKTNSLVFTNTKLK